VSSAERDKSGMAHLVSCFVQDNGQVFTQLKTEGKGTELAGGFSRF